MRLLPSAQRGLWGLANAQRGWWDPANAQKKADGRSAGGATSSLGDAVRPNYCNFCSLEQQRFMPRAGCPPSQHKGECLRGRQTALGRFVAACLGGKKAWLTLAERLAPKGGAAAKPTKRLAA
ncbi:hypothetical protein TSOC_007005 [Tetrabaena socialis]|uniref:Uncharacterized protein n=1 Tax=Tetrabaena socialis TaxID=47790 RepID=A0A2J8A267_9CHLO|nr:hypothetical protein TSOC_007005 [Tetrabaena socialis]|eukprot:PNH06621.1 hypothetical protein TSOC_007005 [Tetrabaena socialis]